jgi:AmmeMemoRadiSam system protein B
MIPAPDGRPAAHAGTFYPSQPERLAALVDSLLRGAPRYEGRDLLAVLVPHAGLEYSGRIAAQGWSAVEALRPRSIVLLGTDHAGLADGAAVWCDGPWLGPFGSVPIDERLVQRLVDLGPPFHADDASHLDEHSLEVQLPFIARVCPGACIAPLLVGASSPRTAEEAGRLLGEVVAEVADPHRPVAIVASSDFAHYPAAAVAREVSRMMLAPILELDGLGLLVADRQARQLPGVACGMCGLQPAVALLAALRLLGARAEVLGEATSADAWPGEASRTVGYAAVAFRG